MIREQAWLHKLSTGPDRDQVAKPAGELGAYAAADDLQHLVCVLNIQVKGQPVDDLHSCLQGLDVAPDDDCGVEVSVQELLSHVQHLPSCAHTVQGDGAAEGPVLQDSKNLGAPAHLG